MLPVGVLYFVKKIVKEGVKMTTSLAIMLILGLNVNALFKKLKLPGLLGMLILGMIVGPYALNWLDADILKPIWRLEK